MRARRWLVAARAGAGKAGANTHGCAQTQCGGCHVAPMQGAWQRPGATDELGCAHAEEDFLAL